MLKKIIFGLLACFMMVSCVVTQKGTSTASVNLQVNVDYSELEYVGEVVGESDQSYLLGIIPVGGRRNTSGAVLSQAPGAFAAALPNNRGISNALYDALQQNPDADFILPISYDSERKVMFLGNKTHYKVRAKVFRLKTTK